MRKPRALWSLLALAQAAHTHNLPYNPTRIYLHPNSSYAYVFGPAAQSSSGAAQLSALDITQPFGTGKPQLSTITTALPFLEDANFSPYTPMIDAGGNITVLAGECGAQGTNDAHVWQFAPAHSSDGGSSGGQGKWTQFQTTYEQSKSSAEYNGPGFLANSIAFSAGIDGDSSASSIYVFGGMCPYDNSTASTWISAAEYSNSILTISPDASNYDLGLMESREAPISQAGASITALPPTFAFNSSGVAQTQQQDFVLLGGNTQNAFINMSQVAMFSLPQQSWSFIDVLQPGEGKADLAIRQSSQVISPRSGHTAVLSENGTNIIIFGGWVGDVSTPAQPQLAILELGSGYGGSGDWRWTVPSQSGTGLAAGAGIYGHGATMLPGGIMLVLGGYAIPSSSSGSKYFRRGTQTANTQTFLYNTTSNSWLRSYTPPFDLGSNSKSGTGPLNGTGEKVGLATGLGVGAALLVTMVGFYVWYGRRVKRAREQRDRNLLSYSSDGSTLGQYNMDQPFLSGGLGASGDDAALARYYSTQRQNPYQQQQMSEMSGGGGGAFPRPPAMQHATGAFVNVPSPTRGLRKGSVGRNYQYQAAPRYDDKRASRGSGNIHPIAEDENEDGRTAEGSLTDAERRLREVERVLNADDPFRDPEPNPLGSHPMMAAGVAGDTLRRVPTDASRLVSIVRRPVPRLSDGANWTVEDEDPDLMSEEQGGGFTVGNGDDRTSSTLSERSQRSAMTAGTMTRNTSTRTVQGMALAAAAGAGAGAAALGSSPQHSPTRDRFTSATTPDSGRTAYFKTRARSSTNGSVPLSPVEDGMSFKSARSTNMPYPQHQPYQSESEALMQGRHTISIDDPYHLAVAAHQSTRGRLHRPAYLSHTPTAAAAPAIPPRRRPGLMGSLRRALNVVSLTDRSFSLTNSAVEHYHDGMRTTASSPTKDAPNPSHHRASGPRRAVSDGGALLRSIRGQKDWDTDRTVWPPYRDDPAANDWGEPDATHEPRSSADLRAAESDWDVEGAATSRDFQVMFSVPKSKLRVVNDDMDRASLRSASDGAVPSRSGSLLDGSRDFGMGRMGSLRRDGSVVRRGERREGSGGGEARRLPATTEEEDGLGLREREREG